MAPSKRPLGFIEKEEAQKNSKYSLPSWLVAAMLITGALAAPIAINLIEFGRGVETRADCTDNLDVNFSYSINSSETTISAISVSNIAPACAGKYLKLTLKGSGTTVLSESTWQIPSSQTMAGASTVNAIVNQSSTSANNGMVNGVFEVYASTVLGSTIASSDVFGVDYLLSDSPISPSPTPSPSPSI